MGFDFESHLGAVERSVSWLERDGLPAGAVTLSRSYATSVEDLWDAVTNGQRIPRWFLPISGELELGGRYQLEGNAGGVITACKRPSRFALTWELGLMGLATHLTQPTEPMPDEAALATSPDGKAFISGSCEGWAQAAVAAGTDPDAARAAARRTTAFYKGESAEPA